MNTPLPWRYGIGEQCREIYDANGALVCLVYENLGDRFRIVRAVNCHDELVEALKIVIEQADLFHAFRDDIGQAVLYKAQTALAKAERITP